ncbi:MAG: hypothetical protein FJ150_01190 [Euryarchaeota archaeon]|nr:hypothetical protein [Euryarchaeota archaeon]
MVVFWLRKFFKRFIPSKTTILVAVSGFISGFLISFIIPQQVFELDFVKTFFSEIEPSSLPDDFMLLYNFFLNNLLVSAIFFFGGILVIIPLVYLFMNIFPLGMITYAGLYKYGLIKSLVLLLGTLNFYPEFLALMLAADSGNRIAKKSFYVIKKDRRNFFLRWDLPPEIEEVLVHEFVNAFSRIILLLLIAAILETFWDPFWTNYWINHIL